MVPSLVTAPSRPTQPRGSWVRRQHRWLQVLLRMAGHPMGAFGLATLLIMATLAILAPVIAPYSPIQQHPGLELAPPGAQFWLGSDDLGRDLFSRILFGARVSFVVGIMATALGALVGVSTGLLSGYLGGWVDSLIMRLYDALLAFPGIIIGIAVISVLGAGTVNVAYALAIGGMPFFARLMRSSVLAEREREYVSAARCIGAGDGRIMLRHVLPNTIAPLLV